MTDPAVLVVGAGPAGLSAARELGVRGVGPVLVVDREADAGGVPRHCDHAGFGLQDLRRSMGGPAYARLLIRRAEEVGARIRTSTTVTGLADDGTVTLVGPGGIESVRPPVVLLATGARERPRSARLVPGDRPAGVFTTGQLQQWVVLHGLGVGRRAVVVGAEHVAYSAVATLRHAGVTTVAMVTDLPRHQTVSVFALAARFGLGVPLRTDSRVVGIHGHGRVEGVEVEDLRSGAVERLAVDTVVFTGDWIPDHELARRAGVVLVPATGGPRTDAGGRTSRAGVLAVGALVQPGDTAGLAALGGREAGRRLASPWSGDWPGSAAGPVCGLSVSVAHPLCSVVPSVVDPIDRPRRLLVRTGSFTDHRLVVARQGGSEVGRHRLRHATPHRTLAVPGSVLARIDPDGGAVELTLV